MVLDSRTEMDVEGGMTRVVRQEDTATGTMFGHSIVRHSHKVMTVTRESLQSGQSSCARVCPLLDKSGQSWI